MKLDTLTPDGMFEYAVDFVLKHEGRYSNHPLDRGGPTNYGLSLAFLKKSGLDIDYDGDIDIEDVKALDEDEAKEIYYREWWDKYHYYTFNDVNIAKKVFDMAVNMGAMQAHKLLQRALNRRFQKSLTVDGILGPKTFRASNEVINTGLGKYLYTELQEIGAEFYVKLGAEKPHLQAFLRGWLNRANE